MNKKNQNKKTINSLKQNIEKLIEIQLKKKQQKLNAKKINGKIKLN